MLKSVRIVKLNVNETCFFKCKTCNFWKNKQKQELLSLDIYSKFFKDLKKIKSPNTSINFTGGEPLISPEIFTLISRANENEFITSINTNGWLLNKENIEKLYAASIKDIIISLDGSLPEIHDKIRGVNGSFRRIINNAKEVRTYFLARGKKITISAICVVSNLNLKDILKLARFIQQSTLFDNIFFSAITAPFFDSKIQYGKLNTNNGDKIYWFEDKKYEYLWPKDKNLLQKVYSTLILMKKKGYKIGNETYRLKMQYAYLLQPKTRQNNIMCGALKDLHIDVKGNISSCYVKKEILGNIAHDSISQIWFSLNTLKQRKNMLKCKLNCHELLNCGDIHGTSK